MERGYWLSNISEEGGDGGGKDKEEGGSQGKNGSRLRERDGGGMSGGRQRQLWVVVEWR